MGLSIRAYAAHRGVSHTSVRIDLVKAVSGIWGNWHELKAAFLSDPDVESSLRF
jgi:hypothetical protein